MLVFAVPAAIAGFQVGKALLSLAGVTGGMLGPMLALGVAAVSALAAAGRTAPTPQG